MDVCRLPARQRGSCARACAQQHLRPQCLQPLSTVLAFGLQCSTLLMSGVRCMVQKNTGAALEPGTCARCKTFPLAVPTSRQMAYTWPLPPPLQKYGSPYEYGTAGRQQNVCAAAAGKRATFNVQTPSCVGGIILLFHPDHNHSCPRPAQDKNARVPGCHQQRVGLPARRLHLAWAQTPNRSSREIWLSVCRGHRASRCSTLSYHPSASASCSRRAACSTSS